MALFKLRDLFVERGQLKMKPFNLGIVLVRSVRPPNPLCFHGVPPFGHAVVKAHCGDRMRVFRPYFVSSRSLFGSLLFLGVCCFRASPIGYVAQLAPAYGAHPHSGNFSRGQLLIRSIAAGGTQVLYRSALTLAIALSAASACAAETGLASYYGGRGHRGEMTCAHRTRPFGSIVTVTHAGQSIRCRVNDRGPFVRGRVSDVSVSAARALGMMRSGIVRVSVE
jgi:rare lipoprotein A